MSIKSIIMFIKMKTKAENIRNQLSYIKKSDKNKKLKVEEKNQIQNSDYEEDIINKLRLIYDDSKFSKEELNTHLILLENKKLSINSVSYSGLITSAISISISMIAIIITINNSVRDLGKYVNELVGNTSEKINSIKDDIELFKKLLDNMPWMLGVFYAIIAGLIVYEGINSINEKRKKIAVNIHKSVIEERLKKSDEKDDVSYSLEELKNKLSNIGDGTSYLKGQMDTLVILHKR